MNLKLDLLRECLLLSAVLILIHQSAAIAQTTFSVKMDKADRSFSALRYMDAVYFDDPKSTKINGEDAVAINLHAVNPSLILLLGYWGEPEISDDMVLYVEYAFKNTVENPELAIELLVKDGIDEQQKGDGRPCGRYIVETETKDEEWFCAEVDITQLGSQVGETLTRVFLYPKTEGGQGQFLVRQLAVCPRGTFVGSGSAKPDITKTDATAKGGIKHLAVHPKTLWYTDEDAFFSEEAVREVADHGYNILGCPVHPPSAPPEKWQADYEMYRETADRIAGFQNIRLKIMMPMCVTVDADFPYSKLIEASGKERMVPCPADEKYWQERIIPCLRGYAELSTDIPTFALMVDWEIYESVGNSYSLCYCDSCWKAFQSGSSHAAPDDLPAAERHQWVWNNDLEESYQKTFYGRIEKLARDLRNSIDEINPTLSFWTLPGVFIGNPFWEPFIKGVATKAAPVVVSNEYTYGKPADAATDEAGIEANVKTCIEDQRKLTKIGVPFLYLAATYNDWGSADYHGRAAVRMAAVSDGLWFFEDVGPYGEGGNMDRNELWQAYKDANEKIILDALPEKSRQ